MNVGAGGDGCVAAFVGAGDGGCGAGCVAAVVGAGDGGCGDGCVAAFVGAGDGGCGGGCVAAGEGAGGGAPRLLHCRYAVLRIDSNAGFLRTTLLYCSSNVARLGSIS